MHKKDTSCFLPGWPYNLHFWGKGKRQGRGLACGLDMSPEGPQGQSFLTPRAMCLRQKRWTHMCCQPGPMLAYWVPTENQAHAHDELNHPEGAKSQLQLGP